MSANRITRTELLIVQALDLPPEELSDFLRKECGRVEEILRKIESLLQAKRFGVYAQL